MGRWGRGQRGESCRPCTGSGASRRLRVYGELLLLHPSSPHGPVYTPYVPPLQAPTATARARDPPEISRNPPELACHRPPLPCRRMQAR